MVAYIFLEIIQSVKYNNKYIRYLIHPKNVLNLLKMSCGKEANALFK